MSIIVFQHHRDEGPYLLGDTLVAHGLKLRTVRLFAGESVPSSYEGVDGVISMGGPMDIGQYDENPWMLPEIDYLRGAHERKLPVMGICLGAQLIAAALGGDVGPMDGVEVGIADVNQTFPGKTDPILSGIRWNAPQMHLHGCEVKTLPPDADLLAGSAKCPVQIYKVGRTTYGFQCHFEWGWSQAELFSQDGLVDRSEMTRDELLKQAKLRFDEYRRLGDRLAKNLALYLFGCGR